MLGHRSAEANERAEEMKHRQDSDAVDEERHAERFDHHLSQMTEEQLLRWYTNLVYRQTGSYQETARRLGIDRRTARARVTP